jgi:hypothetical protein
MIWSVPSSVVTTTLVTPVQTARRLNEEVSIVQPSWTWSASLAKTLCSIRTPPAPASLTVSPSAIPAAAVTVRTPVSTSTVAAGAAAGVAARASSVRTRSRGIGTRRSSSTP